MKLFLQRCIVFTCIMTGLHLLSVAQNCVPTYLPVSPTPLNGSIISLPCGQSCIPITFQTTHYKQTSTYVVNDIPYSPYPYLSPTGAEDPVLYADDQYSTIVPIPFPFPFYDSIFTKTIVGSNGLITFDIANASCNNAYTISQQIPFSGGNICNLSNAYYPRSSIMGAYSDLDPRTIASPSDRKIQWHVEGSAPCRKFVVSYYHIGVYGNNSCGLATPNTFQIVIHESSGIIDVFYERIQCSSSTNAGRSIAGVQNWPRDQAVAPAGMNSTPVSGSAWQITNKAYRFTPAAGASKFVSSELTTLAGTHLAWADTTTTVDGILDLGFPNVCPVGSSTQYVVRTFFGSNTDPIQLLYSYDTVTINRTGNLNATATTTTTTCGPPTGSITVTVPSGVGTPPYNYVLDGGTPVSSTNSTYTFTNVGGGPHTIIITDAGGCSSTVPVTVTSSGTLSVSATTTPTACSGVNNGTITVLPPVGTAPFLYSINGGPTQPGNVFNNLAAGSYTVTVQDAGGCIGNTIINVQVGPSLTATTTSTATSCNGASNGTITVTATSGTPPFQYSIDGGVYQASNVFNNVSSGVHFIVVKDALACTSNTINVSVAAGAPITGTATSSPTTCGGVNNGGITATATSGTAPYQYSLNGGPNQSSNVFTNLAAGNYTVVITDAAGCFSASIPVTIVAGGGLTANTASTPTSCPGVNNGTITITPTNGTAPYQFSLNGGTYQTSNVFNNLAAGSYFIVILDATGCTSNTINVNVATGNGITGTATSTNTSCAGVNNGTITVTPTSGASPYQYSLDGAPYQPNNVFTNVAAGSHTVVIKDAAGCLSNNIAVTVGAGAGITGTATSTPTSCNGVNNGTVTVTATSGQSPYQYSIDGGGYQTSNVFTNVSAGNHNVVIQDAPGCISNAIAVTVNAGNGISASATSTPTTCPGVNNGTITVTSTNGTTPYQYSLDAGTAQSGNIFNNVSPGSHAVIVTDAVGCTSSAIVVNVATGNGITVNATSTPTSCNGVNNGTITVTPANGSAPYQYALDGGAAQTGNVFNNVAAGPHTVIVTDAAGCISSPYQVTVAAGNGISGTAASTATTCNGASNGTITVSATNGTSPYQYSLNGGPAQTSNIFNNLAAGNYTIAVTDANGCTATNLQATITAGPALTAVVTPTNISCNGLTNGSFIVNVAATGTPPYQYSLDNINFQTSNLFSGLAAANYTVYFRDNSGCTGNQTAVIAEPEVLSVNVSPQPVLCNGQANGTITIAAAGGVTPYQYSLNGISYQSNNVFNVAAGVYTVYIKDNNGCTKSQPNIVINQPAVVSVSAVSQNATCNGGGDGTITATATGGNAGFQYSLDGVSFQPSNTFNVIAGNYTVTAKDANNCTASTQVTVALTNNLSFVPGNNPTICEGGSIQLTTTTNATQFAWTPVSSLNNSTIANPTASPTATTTYDVVARLGSCTANGSITVFVNPAPKADAGADPDICFGQDAQLNGSGGVSYQWSPSTYLSNASIANPQVSKPPQDIQYSLKVTDANGCTSLTADVVKVKVTPPIKVYVNPKDTIVAEGDSIQLSALSIAINYNWSNSSTLSNAAIPNPVAIMPSGSLGNIYTYTVVVTTAAGCTGTETVKLKVYKGPDIYMVTGFTPNGDGKNERFIPFPVGIKKLHYFRVYNRWGQLLYSTTTLNEGWDGNVGGKAQPVGVYVWVIEGVTKDDKLISKKGTVTLIR